MISIIIPTYQDAKYLIQTLKGILNQSYQNFETIIVDDGLKEEARKKIEKYLEDKNKEKIKLIKQVPAGAPAARNKGFRQSSGDFLFFCDDDIILEKNVLGKMIEILNKHLDISYVYCDFYLDWKKFKSFNFNEERLKKMPYISAMSLIRREHFPGWDESLKKFQDWDLWLTMLEKGHRGYHISEALFKAIPRKRGMSNWLPSFCYKIPWHIFPFKLFIPQVIIKYEQGVKIIKEKHRLGK